MSAQSNLFAAGSLVRTLASQATAQELKALAQDCGESTPVLLANFDQTSCSWKTSPRFSGEECQSFAEIWPESGTTRNGQLFLRAPWGRHTCDDECSLWPTPTASMDGRGFGIPMHNRTGRYRQAVVSRVQELVGSHGWRIHPNFTEALMGFPTDWSAIEDSETPCVQTAPNGSAAAS
jgi:hypothetical protein